MTGAPIAYLLTANYEVSEDEMRNCASKTIWSTHQYLSEEKMQTMVNLVPKTGQPLQLSV